MDSPANKAFSPYRSPCCECSECFLLVFHLPSLAIPRFRFLSGEGVILSDLLPLITAFSPTPTFSIFLHRISAEKATVEYDPAVWTPEKLAEEINVSTRRVHRCYLDKMSLLLI